MYDPICDVDDLRRTLAYDPETGIFTNRHSRKNSPVPGVPLGFKDRKGYLRLRFRNATFLAHRLAWFYVHGAWPTNQIDHADHDRTNNRIGNLRPCTNAENRQNIRPEGYGESGFLGVSRAVGADRWTAMITVDGRAHYLGCFKTPEEASAAYLAEKQKLHTFATAGDIHV